MHLSYQEERIEEEEKRHTSFLSQVSDSVIRIRIRVEAMLSRFVEDNRGYMYIQVCSYTYKLFCILQISCLVRPFSSCQYKLRCLQTFNVLSRCPRDIVDIVGIALNI